MDQLLPGVVEVKYRGLLGNRLAQYCLGRIIASELKFALYAPPIPGFPNARSLGPRFFRYVPARRFEAVLGGHRIRLRPVLSNRQSRLLVLWGLFLRYEYFRRYKAKIRDSWLAQQTFPAAESHPDDLTIHIRSGPDIWEEMTDGRSVHPEYHAMPFSFYEEIVARRRWRSITVVTAHVDDPMVEKLARRFGSRVRSETALEDFACLRSARNLVLSVSTFAWWAAWLSNATQIFYPVVGLFDSERAKQRPRFLQQDLWVADEPRYVPLRPRLPEGPWRGTREDRVRLLEA